MKTISALLLLLITIGLSAPNYAGVYLGETNLG